MDTTGLHEKMELLRIAFKGLDDEELREMASLTHLNVYPQEHILCREGAYEEVFYIIADGNAAITKKIGEEEGERVLRLAGKGDLVGEMALIQNAPRSATVRAVSRITVLEMGKKDFEVMLSRSPRMGIDIIRTTLDRMRANDQMAIQDLQKTNAVLRQLDRNKLEFIQVAAHELRTPLTVLKGYVNVLRAFPELKANESLGEVLNGILKGADRMHEVVNLMLDVTRVDSDVIKISAVPIILKREISDLVMELSKPAGERSISIDLDLDADTPIINGDPTLIYKAIYHLLVNAIKFTPDGGRITVRTRSVIMDGNTPAVEVSMTDTGIGLDDEHKDLIFEKFYQVAGVEIHSSGKTSYKGGGPGLGLAIVRGVARAHGGKVWVESAGHDEVNFPGCTFRLQLPVNPSKSE